MSVIAPARKTKDVSLGGLHRYQMRDSYLELLVCDTHSQDESYKRDKADDEKYAQQQDRS